MSLALNSLRLRNFKAVKDSGAMRFGALTAFVGDNGTGKSSALEALRFAATLATTGLDAALDPFGGFQHLRWKGGRRVLRDKDGETTWARPVALELSGHAQRARVRAETRIEERGPDRVAIAEELLRVEGATLQRDARGAVSQDGVATRRVLRAGFSLLSETSWFDGWQHLDLAPGAMGRPAVAKQSTGRVTLASDGSNLAEYLLELRELSLDAWAGLLEAMQVVLPYATDLQPQVSDAFERRVAMWMTEGSFKLPGWMFSTGTLRVLCLLALLRHPKPPTLLCVEEIENGLDPRTVHLVVDELLRAVEDDRMQVILTTHSPYLLDLLPLESVVLVTREPGEPPTFHRPAEEETVRAWAKRFAPGKLYTTGSLHARDRKP